MPVRCQSLDEVNAELKPVGTKIWTRNLSALPDDLKRFLADPDPADQWIAKVVPRFLLSRQRMLELIADAGRRPHVPGGGELTTLDQTHDVTYPQLYVARSQEDFSRFDRYHVNIGDDGVAVDDVVQLLSGGGLVVGHRLPNGDNLSVFLDCPSVDRGWLLSVDCANPFIGSFSGALPGTKALSQVIGPARWRMKYLE